MPITTIMQELDGVWTVTRGSLVLTDLSEDAARDIAGALDRVNRAD